MALVLKQLLAVCPPSFGDKPNKYGWYPLHILANNRDDNKVRAGMIALLCKAKANVDVTKNRGMTPLMCAVSTGHQNAADVLILQGADVHLESSEGTTMLDMAWHNSSMKHWAAEIGVGGGAGVSGSGRLPFVCRFGDKPVLILLSLFFRVVAKMEGFALMGWV
jgi:hypothetical protein